MKEHLKKLFFTNRSVDQIPCIELLKIETIGFCFLIAVTKVPVFYSINLSQ